MNKLNLIFLLVIVITYINTSGDLVSECVDYDNRQVSESICNKLETSNKSKFICVLNQDGKNCEEIASSECTTKFSPPQEPVTRRRVESEVIDDEDCYNLKTSDKYNYECVISGKKDRCLEALIDSECTDTFYKPGKFTKEDCNKLETSNKKYKCVPSSDQTYCVQNDSIVINRFNLFVLTLCLLSLF